MRMSTGIVCGGLLALCVSCTEYTPKPRGYFRIEPPAPSYQALPVRDLPYTFRLSRWAEVELPPVGNPAGWINLSYPQLNVKLYCSYFSITPATLGRAEEECRARWWSGNQNIRNGSRCRRTAIRRLRFMARFSCWMANPLRHCNLC